MLRFSSLLQVRAWLASATGLLAVAAGCTYSHGDPAPACSAATAVTATYQAVVSPIFDANCRTCHATNVYLSLGGGTRLDSYQDVKNYSSSRLLGVIRHENGLPPMPQGQPQLSDCDIARIQAWVDAGQLNN